jgi:REP element-mobilizing transposase RayT
MRGNPGCLVWQRNYYERIIRDENELAATREYIMYNPIKWVEDEENPAS